VRGQGPRANGMPELHKLMPLMGALQDRGYCVALATDGRMSGASGKVLAAIHITPEAAEGGPLAKLRDGDVLRVDAESGVLDVVSPLDWRERAPVQLDLLRNARGVGRELFSMFRANACSAERGGSAFPDYDPI
jgi:phosphogluconate dehydratase